ncbi:MAG: SDR family NAD(P)-dependent oxidoreductase [Ignavibacterium sp.]|nr:SDR family NAD(P)-dependent oxidoreductase [Ignavibacterium sp.]
MKKRKVSLVTGANRGIGKAIALSLAKENHDVILFGRDESALKNVYDEIISLGVKSDFYSGDVRDVDFVNTSIYSIIEKYGTIDILINNAGFGIFKKFIDSSLQEFKDQVDVNLFGVYNFTKAAAPYMIKQKGGSIINISSLAGKNSFVGGTMYSSSKFALMGFSRSLMLELREFDIRVVLICPGSVETEFFVDSGHPTPLTDKVLRPEDIADAVLAVINLPVRAMVSEIDIRPTNPK